MYTDKQHNRGFQLPLRPTLVRYIQVPINSRLREQFHNQFVNQQLSKYLRLHTERERERDDNFVKSRGNFQVYVLLICRGSFLTIVFQHIMAHNLHKETPIYSAHFILLSTKANLYKYYIELLLWWLEFYIFLNQGGYRFCYGENRCRIVILNEITSHPMCRGLLIG